ncbi:hypothetical protein LQW54_008750 [Pestalotiopsis sp. IQ-011]
MSGWELPPTDRMLQAKVSTTPIPTFTLFIREVESPKISYTGEHHGRARSLLLRREACASARPGAILPEMAGIWVALIVLISKLIGLDPHSTGTGVVVSSVGSSLVTRNTRSLCHAVHLDASDCQVYMVLLREEQGHAGLVVRRSRVTAHVHSEAEQRMSLPSSDKGQPGSAVDY